MRKLSIKCKLQKKLEELEKIVMTSTEGGMAESIEQLRSELQANTEADALRQQELEANTEADRQLAEKVDNIQHAEHETVTQEDIDSL